MGSVNIGNRLRTVREERGLSQEAVASKITLSRTAITQIESGQRKVSTLELTKFAEIYHLPVGNFFEDKPKDALSILYRSEPGLENSNEVNECIVMCREGVDLEAKLGKAPRSGPPAYNLPAPKNVFDAVEQGNKVAQEERRRLHIGNAPILDVSELICKQGIWASALRLPDKISGLFVHDNSIGFVIIVNGSHVLWRKRFSYAHEYAHALIDREHKIAAVSKNTGDSKDLVETRANSFAASFLMPRGGMYEVLRDLDKGLPSRENNSAYNPDTDEAVDAEKRIVAGSQRVTYNDVATCAHRFGVSYRSALYRLSNLKFISKDTAAKLLEQEEYGKSYLRELHMLEDIEEKVEKKFWNRDLRKEIASLAINAYARDKISIGRLLDLNKILRFEEDTLQNLAEVAREGLSSTNESS